MLFWTTKWDSQFLEFILERFVTELDLYRSVAFLYSLYTLYITQLGFLDDEDNGDNGDSQLPIVSIPIDLSMNYGMDWL